jgi:hypothetical protein
VGHKAVGSYKHTRPLFRNFALKMEEARFLKITSNWPIKMQFHNFITDIRYIKFKLNKIYYKMGIRKRESTYQCRENAYI